MKTYQKLCALSLAGVLSAGLLSACAGGSGSQTKIKFLVSGEVQETTVMKAIMDEYNEGQGKEDGVKVNYAYSPDLNTSLLNTYSGSQRPDLFIADDRYFKSYVNMGFVADLDELQKTTGIELDVSDMYSSGISRYRYDVATNTSNENDPLYGVVRGLSPTIIYYNKTAFESVGVICVSVPEEEIDDAYATAFNAKYGSYFNKEHLKRGFVRQSVVDFYEGDYSNPGYAWEKPQPGEVMVFNDQIPMSWEETEDLGRITTKSHNESSITQYGFYTWWWFCYGFSVGGDCIEDITGEGDWVFTLKDTVPNLIVRDGYEGTLHIGENDYAAGEIIGYRDRVTVSAEKQADILTNSSDLDASYLSDQVKGLIESGDLLELPSERDAFIRFVHLAQTKDEPDGYGGYGLAIAPQASENSKFGNAGRFTNGSCAMIINKSNELLLTKDTIDRNTGDSHFEWNVAPLPMYKEYNNDGTVKVHGIQAGASDSSAYCINSYSSDEKQEAAMKFLKYLCSKSAQDYAASTGFTLPNRPDCVQPYLDSDKTLNLKVIADAAFYETPGDWWYMSDKTWIDNNWAADLNNSVRNNKMTLEQFFAKFSITQAALNQYNPKNK